MINLAVLDLYSCQGGAGKGYRDAGCEVTGVDINPQPRYPYRFVQAEAIQFLLMFGHRFDFIHASPPCQLYSQTQRIMQNEHPDLLGPTRDALNAVGVPWVIENVMGAQDQMRDPVLLCGAGFGLQTYRHRLFEAGGWELPQPDHPEHVRRQSKMGRRRAPDEMGVYVGNFIGVEGAKDDLGVPWMTRNGIRECIPPAYTQYVAQQFINQREESS